MANYIISSQILEFPGEGGGGQDFNNYMKTRYKSEHSFDINPVIE